MTGLLLVGGGGHCRAAIDVIESAGLAIAGVLDRPEVGLINVLGHPVLGGDEVLPSLVEQGLAVLITIGQIKSAEPRIRAFNAAQAAGAGEAPPPGEPDAGAPRKKTEKKADVVDADFEVVDEDKTK